MFGIFCVRTNWTNLYMKKNENFLFRPTYMMFARLKTSQMLNTAKPSSPPPPSPANDLWTKNCTSDEKLYFRLKSSYDTTDPFNANILITNTSILILIFSKNHQINISKTKQICPAPDLFSPQLPLNSNFFNYILKCSGNICSRWLDVLIMIKTNSNRNKSTSETSFTAMVLFTGNVLACFQIFRVNHQACNYQYLPAMVSFWCLYC